MTTYSDILTRHQVEIPGHLVAQAEVPVLAGPQCQGDLIVIPASMVRPSVTRPAAAVPAEGVPVVRGEAGGNTHLLVADGVVVWAPCDARQDLGVVDVAEGAIAYLLHPEHGANALAPGRYLLRRQREQADEIRLVAD